jgi:hypothetical protein
MWQTIATRLGVDPRPRDAHEARNLIGSKELLVSARYFAGLHTYSVDEPTDPPSPIRRSFCRSHGRVSAGGSLLPGLLGELETL